ncbi:hypothetical protein [Kordiimonas laminariae]|uniref:hypothetical protein n=1 Tax=Kordiimonas laminariae TaxID=2917717 RepID=UPI001FF5D9F9|nr:hypothetical protein [Kordiimonas laminariae]MCK0068998.1 hypothetical protein [Kordiimonas laminariae]
MSLGIKNFRSAEFKEAAKQHGLKNIYEDSFFRITCYEGEGDEVCLSFLGIGEGIGGISLQKEEFFGTASAGCKRSVIFIFDKKRHWFHSHEKNKVLFDFIRNYCAEHSFKKTFAIGNSMGAFGALVATRYMKIDRILAISPQYSMDLSIIPEENRWKEWQRRIPSFEVQTIDEGNFDNGLCFIIHGAKGIDSIHTAAFPKHRNIYHYVMPNEGHEAVKAIKAQGYLIPAVNTAFTGRIKDFHTLMLDKGLILRERPNILQGFINRIKMIFS